MPQPSRFTWRQRLRYRFDNVFTRGAVPVLLLLVAAMLVLFVLAGLTQAIFNWGPSDKEVGFVEGMWLAFVRSLDPGTFGGDEGTHFRFIGLVITLLGVVAMAVVIGLVSSGIDTRLTALRQGRSLVVESDHTVVLGASHKVVSIVSELVVANASRRKAAIVVLSPLPTSELEHLIRSSVPDLRTSRLILRSGDPANANDLAKVSPETARSIIVLNSEYPGSDSSAVKATMAVLRLVGDSQVPVVTEVQDRAVADALRVATQGRVLVIVSSEIVGKLTAQVGRTAGLSMVHQDLLDFDGDEIYLAPGSTLESWRYGDILLAFPTCSPIGIRRADGGVELNPPMDRLIEAGEDVFILAEDEGILPSEPSAAEWDGVWTSHVESEATMVERSLIVGWSHYVGVVAREIDGYVAPGSTLDLVIDPALVPAGAAESLRLLNQELRVHHVDSLDLPALERVVRSQDFDHVLLMCYRDALDADDADARTLLTLMAVRAWLAERSSNLVTEVLKIEDATIAEVARPDDFVVSERLMSLALAQISENPDLATIFNELLDSARVSVRMHSWTTYDLESTATYHDVVVAARGRGESAIGWRCAALAGQPRDLGGGVFINPPKGMAARFGGEDRVIVIG